MAERQPQSRSSASTTRHAPRFLEIADLVVSVLDGFNTCIFAFGQTVSANTSQKSIPPSWDHPDLDSGESATLTAAIPRLWARHCDVAATLNLSLSLRVCIMSVAL